MHLVGITTEIRLHVVHIKFNVVWDPIKLYTSVWRNLVSHSSKVLATETNVCTTIQNLASFKI